MRSPLSANRSQGSSCDHHSPMPDTLKLAGKPHDLCSELQEVGLSCRWLDGARRQQCAGHQPFERQATMNGGFSILPTGSTDPQRLFAWRRRMLASCSKAVSPGEPTFIRCTSTPGDCKVFRQSAAEIAHRGDRAAPGHNRSVDLSKHMSFDWRLRSKSCRIIY